MANNQGKINFQVGFNVDRSGLNGLKQQLQELQNLSQKDLLKINSQASITDLQEIQKAAAQVQKALEDSFNPKLNTTDLTKFKKALGDMGIDKLKASFDKAGQSGVNAFRNVTTEILTTNRQLKESNKWLDKMAETMANTVRWSIASSALNAVTQSIQKAWSFTKQLDSSLNDIQIVTQMSADQMDRFAVKATKAAQALGATTRNYSDAALIYYQQGLSDQEVEARSNVTVKVANVTGQSAQQVSEQLTAVWNGYKVNAEESEKYIDKLSAVARTTAADLEELSTGMSKVASAANSMGVDIDSLNAQLATIVSVTREAPESIGTALKTVYARMSDIEAGLDTETTLGEYTSQMAQMGVNVLDAEGNLRDMGAVVEEIGNNWDNLNRNQQVSLAQTIAGTRQYSRMIALFDNWDMYQSAKRTSVNSTGDLQKQQEIYLESMEAHLNELTAEAEELYQTLMDPEGLNPLIDTLTTIVGLGENIIEGIGGGAGLLLNLGSIGLNVFGNQITKGISRSIRNIQGFKENLRQAAAEAKIIEEYNLTNIEDPRTQKILDAAKERLKVTDKLSEEEREVSDALIKQTNNLYKQQDALKERQRISQEIAKNFTGEALDFSNLDQTKKDIEDSFNELSKFTINKDSTKFFKNLYADQQEIDSSFNRAKYYKENADMASQAGNLAVYNAQLEQYTQQIERNAQAKAKLKENEEIYRESAKDLIDTLTTQITELDGDTVASKANEEQKLRLQQILGKIQLAFDKEGNIIAKNKQQIQEAEDAIKDYNRVIAEMQQQAKDAVDNLENLNRELQNNEKQVQEAEQALEQMKNNFKLTEAIDNVVQLTGGVANLSSAINTLIDLPSIWENDDLTTGEKILQTVSNLAFVLPMLGSGIKNIREGWKGLGNTVNAILDIAIAKQTAAAAANTARVATEKEVQKENVKTAGTETVKKEATNAANNETTETVIKNAAKVLSEKEVQKQNLLTAATEAIKAMAQQGKGDLSVFSSLLGKQMGGDTDSVPIDMFSVMFQGGTADVPLLTDGSSGAANTVGKTGKRFGFTNKFKSSQLGGKVSQWWKGGGAKAVGNVAGYAGAIALVVAATAAAISITKAIDEKAQKEFESAKQEAEMLASEAERAESSYEELSSSIDSLEDNQDNLKKLTKGTLEWKEALYEVNQQVLDLVAKYPELMQYMSTNEDGVMSISQEGLQKVQEEQFEEMRQTNAASIAAQNRAKRAEIEVQKDRFAEQAAHGGANQAAISGTTVGSAGAAGGIIGGILAATASSAAAGSVAPGIGTLIGAAVGIAVGAVGAIATNVAMEAAEDKYQNQLDSEAMDKVVEAYQISGESIFKSSETLAAALGKDVSALSSLELALLDNKDETIALIESMASLEATNRALAIQMGATFVGDEATEGEKALAGNEYDRLTQEYLARYKANAGGNTQDKEEAIRALELMGLSAANLKGAKGKNMIQYIDEDGNEKEMTMDQVYAKLAADDANKAMASRTKEITAAFDALDKITLKNDNIKNYISSLGQGGFSLASATFEELMEMDALELKPEQLQEMAKIQNTTADALIKQFDKAVDDAITANKEAAKNWEDDLRYSFALNFGDIGLSVFNDLFSKIGEDTEKLHEFYDAFKRVTWTDDESVEEFRNALINLFGKDNLTLIDNFISLSKRNQGVRFDIKKAQEGYSVVNKVLESLEKAGDTISASDWESLPKYLQDYFVVMADGTYALIEDAKTLKELFGNEYFADLEDQINTVQTQLNPVYKDTLPQLKEELKTANKDLQDINDKLKESGNAQKIKDITDAFTTLTNIGGTSGSAATGKRVSFFWADTGNREQNLDAYLQLFRTLDEYELTSDDLRYQTERYKSLTDSQKQNLDNLFAMADTEFAKNVSDYIGDSKSTRQAGFFDAIGVETAFNENGDSSIDVQRALSALDVIDKADVWFTDKELSYYRSEIEKGNATLEMLGHIDKGLRLAEEKINTLEAEQKAAEAEQQEAQRKVDEITAKINGEDLDPEKRKELEKELKNLQTQYAASAGSKDKFLQAVEAGIITDGEIIEDYYKYYDNLAETLADVNSWNVDVYEEINRELERAQRNYDALTEAQNKLTGQALLDNLNKQNKALEKQIDLQRQKADKDKEESIDAKEELINYLNTLALDKNIELAFDKNGYLNAGQLYTDLAKNHSQGKLTKEDKDKVEELAEAYNATIDAAIETKDAIKELIYSKLDINAQKIEVELEFKTNLTELTTSYNEFLNDVESGFGEINYATVSKRAGENLDAIENSIKAYETAYETLNNMEVISPAEVEFLQKVVAEGTMSAKEMNKIIGDRITLTDKENQLQNIRSGIMDTVRSKQAEILSIEENYSAALDEINAKYEKQISLCDTLITLNEDLAELSSLLGGGQSAAETQATSLNYMKQSLGVTIEQFNTAKAEYDKLTDPTNKNYADYQALSEERKQEIIDNYKEAAKATTGSLKEIATAAYELFKTSIEEDLTQSLYGTLNTTLVDATAEWAKSQGETYLDAVDTAYELDKIAYKYDEILTSLHGNAAAQQVINTARQREIELLETKGRLTKDDLDRAQKALDLEMARIALEEAQANKTQMRLVRGANGAYSYQYTKDLSDIAKKEQKVKDTENALINANQKLLQNSISTAEEARKNWQQAYTEAWSDKDITDEEKLYLTQLEESYKVAVEGVNHYLGIYADSLNMSEQELLEYLRVNESSAEGVSIYQVHMIEKFQAGADAALAEFEGKLNGHKGTLDQTLTEIETAMKQLDLDVDTEGLKIVKELVVKIRDTITSDLTSEFNNLGAEIGNLKEIISGTDNQEGLLSGLDTAKDTFDQLVTDSQHWLENIQKAIEALQNMPSMMSKATIEGLYTNLKKRLAEGESVSKTELAQFRNAIDGYVNGGGSLTAEELQKYMKVGWAGTRASTSYKEANITSDGSKTSVSGVGQPETDNKNSDGYEVTGYLKKKNPNATLYYYPRNDDVNYVYEVADPKNPKEGTDEPWIVENMVPVASEAIFKGKDGNYYIDVLIGNKVERRPLYRNDDNFQLFDTGGYTGAWGDSSGRLAMLHEKELVLNKTDTKNILDVIDIVRQLDMSMLHYTAGLSQIKANFANHTVNNTQSNPVQQQIQINAEFPNAENAEEIREAFNQLFNLAEQYAHEDHRF